MPTFSLAQKHAERKGYQVILQCAKACAYIITLAALAANGRPWWLILAIAAAALSLLTDEIGTHVAFWGFGSALERGDITYQAKDVD